MVHRLNQHEAAAAPASLSDEQFARLEELLLPGYELSKLLLAQYKTQAAAARQADGSDTTG